MSLDRRIDHLKKMIPPEKLPPKVGGYEIEIRLKKPIRAGPKSWVGQTSETITWNGFIGFSDEVLELYKQLYNLLETKKAERLKDLGPPVIEEVKDDSEEPLS